MGFQLSKIQEQRQQSVVVEGGTLVFYRAWGGTRELFGGDGSVLCLNWGGVTRVCMSMKAHHTPHVGSVRCTARLQDMGVVRLLLTNAQGQREQSEHVRPSGPCRNVLLSSFHYAEICSQDTRIPKASVLFLPPTSWTAVRGGLLSLSARPPRGEREHTVPAVVIFHFMHCTLFVFLKKMVQVRMTKTMFLKLFGMKLH